MAAGTSTYYGLTRVREASPSIKDWAATDGNFEIIGLLAKALEQHKHNASTAFQYPGYNVGNPNAPTLPALSEVTTGGILSPGVTVGVRLAYKDAIGLETDAAPEASLQLSAAAARALTPILVSKQANTPGLSGGTYIYGITKKKGSGETLISDILPVDISYDTTYSVSLQFDAINTYSDGTTALNIYRATGLNAQFQLVTTVSTTTQTTFTDTNTIASGNQNVQPPTTNTFDSAKKVHISWSALTHPGAAKRLRVYVTQQTGIWSNSSLLADYDLTASPPTFVDYLGSEALQSGTPNNASQLASSPAKLDLGTEATGAPVLTANMSFAGFQAQNMLLHKTTSPTTADGSVYYDTSINNVRARINGSWVNWGTTTASAYTHPAEESGGHIAANIKFASGSAVTSRTVFDTLRDSNGNQKQVTKVVKAAGSTSAPTTSSTTAVLLTDMTVTVTPDVASQWYEAVFSGLFSGNILGMNLTVAIEYDGSTIDETIRTYTIPVGGGYVPIQVSYLTQLGTAGASKITRVLWWVDTGTATAVTTRRALVCKVLF